MADTELEALIVRLEHDSSEFKAQLLESQKAFSSATVRIEKSLAHMATSSEKELGFFAKAAQTALGVFSGQALLDGIQSAGHMIKEVFSEIAVGGVQEAMEGQAALQRLNTQMALTGEYSAKAARDFKEFTASLASGTAQSESAITSALALAKAYGATNEQAKGIVSAATDVAAALGKDLNSAVVEVAGTLSGTVSRDMKKAIQGLGDMGEGALKAGAAIDIIGKRFAGSAASEMATFAGSLTKTKVLFGEFTEELGDSVVSNQAVTFAMKEATKIMGEFKEWAEKNKDAIKKWVGEGLIVAIDVMRVFGDVADVVMRGVSAGIHSVLYASTKLGLVLGLLNEKFADEEAASHVKAIGDAWEGPTAAAKVFESALVRIKSAAQDGMTQVQAGATATVIPINNASVALTKLTEAQKAAGDAGKSLADSLNKENPQGDFSEGLEYLQAQKEAELLTEAQFYDAKLALMQEKLAAEQELIVTARAQNKITEDEYHGAMNQLQMKSLADKTKAEQEHTKIVKQQNQQRAADQKATLSYISGLQQSSIAELFAVGKAAAIAIATIDGITAVQKALSAFPPPFNFVMAGLVGAAAATNISKIASQQPPKFAQGGIVPGQSTIGDQVPVLANSGEMMLNNPQQRRLFDIANGRGGNAGGAQVEGLLGAILNRLNQMDLHVTVGIDGRAGVETVNDQIRSGRRLATA